MARCSFEMELKKTFVHVCLHCIVLNYILQGTMRNMASPALGGLIIDFFYTGPSALGNLFPEVFAREAPKSIVCLAATAVSTHFFHNTS